MSQRATVRPYQAQNQEDVRRVCIDTAPSFSEKQRPILLNLYCDYYIEQEPQNCFVLADGDRVVGYILTAADWPVYRQRFEELYLPQLKQLSKKHYWFKRLELWNTQKLADRYPAHLHIDITGPYQRGGYGRELMAAALNNLRAQGVRGIQLGVGVQNTGAIRFYEKCGFQRLKATRFAILYGLSLTE